MSVGSLVDEFEINLIMLKKKLYYISKFLLLLLLDYKLIRTCIIRIVSPSFI